MKFNGSKILFIILALWVNIQSGYSQNVGINTTGALPHASAILDIVSTTRGVLIPRMTTIQRNAIAAPAEGLLIYNLDCKDINLFNGTAWISMMLSSPTALAASGVGPTQFTANWTNDGSTAYFLDVSTSATFATFVPGFNNLNVGAVTTFNVTGITCGTTYYYRIRGSNACGTTSNSNVISITPSCCINNYNVASIAYAPIAGVGTSVFLGDDQESAALPIGFTFNFYCANYTNFYISSNGFINFSGGMGSGCCGGQLLPNATMPNNLIAGGWDDLYPPGAGSINYFNTGVAPNRRLIVNFTGIPFCCGTTVGVSFQIILFETTNQIEIHGANYNGISPGTIGVENLTGTLATTPAGRNSGTWTSTNESWRFF